MSHAFEYESLLLTFAHRGEAKAFLQEYKHTAQEDNFYELQTGFEGLKVYLLITGEGFEEAMSSLSYILGRSPEIKRVINYGVCGLLRKELALKINDLVAIKSVYADSYQNKQMTFKSFQLSSHADKYFDLVSTHERILDPKKADHLDNFAPLVDRELWSLAYTCQKRNVELESYKIISDYADGEICQQVKEEAEIWSDLLLRHFFQLCDTPSISVENPSYLDQFLNDEERDSFHITLSQERALERILQAHFIKGNNFQELKESIELNSTIEEKKRPKDKTKDILQKLTESLNPMEVRLKKNLKMVTFQLEKLGAQVKHDQDFDKEKLHLSTTLQSQEDFERLANALKDFPFEKWSSLLRGEDV